MRRAMLKNPPNSNVDVENISLASPTPITIPTHSSPANSTPSGRMILPRLVARDRIFFQSSNNVRVRHQSDARIFWLLLKYDWFHLFLRCSILWAIGALLGIWTGMILMFAAIYKSIDDNHPQRNCGLAPLGEVISYHTAFAFSLETCKYTMIKICGFELIQLCFSLSSLSPSFDCCSSFFSPLQHIPIPLKLSIR